MSIADTDLTDLDPTEADLLAAEDDDLFADDEATVEDSDDLDFDSNYEDDRYSREGRNGMPSWSLFA